LLEIQEGAVFFKAERTKSISTNLIDGTLLAIRFAISDASAKLKKATIQQSWEKLR
jgi:hypothetical protein